MSLPTGSEDQYISFIGTSLLRTTDVTYDDNGLVSGSTFELNWYHTRTVVLVDTDSAYFQAGLVVEAESADSWAYQNLSSSYINAYDQFISDEPGDFKGSATLYLQTVGDDTDALSYLYDALNTDNTSDPSFVPGIASLFSDSIQYTVAYSGVEIEALKSRFSQDGNSLTQVMEESFEARVNEAVALSFRTKNQYKFQKLKLKPFTEDNVSALRTSDDSETTSTFTEIVSTNNTDY